MSGATSLHHADEQTGDGVRELNQRLKTAATIAELQDIVATAEQRRTQQGLPPSIETAYQVLSELAHHWMHEMEDAHDD